MYVGGPTVPCRLEPQRAASFGITTADLTETVEAALGGTAASTMIERGRAIKVRVMVPADYRNSLDQLRSLRVHSPVMNGFVRIDQASTIEYDPGQTEINRDGLRRAI